MQQGTVTWYSREKGYGFIAGDNGRDAFVHQSNILMNGFRFLEPGQNVSYDTEQTEKGIRAINVAVNQ